MNVSDIPVGLLDEVEYFRARLNSNYTLDQWHATSNWSAGNYADLNALKTTSPHLKTLIGLGIYSDRTESYETSQMTAFRTILAGGTAQSTFCSSVASFLNTHGFDGISISWEWPQPGTSEKTQFTSLLSALRTALGSGKLIHVQITGNTGLGSSNKVDLSQWDVANFATYVDAIYANTVDYTTWSSAGGSAHHNAPLFSSPNRGDGAYSAHGVMKALNDIGGSTLLAKVRFTVGSAVQRFEVEPEFDDSGHQRSIAHPVFGLGRTYAGGSGYGGWPSTTDTHYNTFVSNILAVNNYDGYIHQYDPVHVAETLFKPTTPINGGADACEVVSFQGLRSLADKMAYVRNESLPFNLECYPVWQQPGNRLGGIRLWSTDNDYLADASSNHQWGLHQGIEDYLFTRRSTGWDAPFTYPSGPNQGTTVANHYDKVYGPRNAMDFVDNTVTYSGGSSPWNGGGMYFVPAATMNSSDRIRFYNVFQNVNTAITSGDHQRKTLRFEIIHMSRPVTGSLVSPIVKFYVWRYDTPGWTPLTIDGTSTTDETIGSVYWKKTKVTINFSGFTMAKVMGTNGQVNIRVLVRPSDGVSQIPEYIVDRIQLTNPRDN